MEFSIVMEQFVVPQFIDVEDKILGPITTRQFVLMIVAGLFLVIAYKLFDISLFVLTVLIVCGLVGLFGFYKVNGRPFHLFLSSFIQVGVKAKLRVWNKTDEIITVTDAGDTAPVARPQARPRLSRTRLAELALQVDTGGIYQAESLEKSQ